jgi:hypothetical protein
MNGDSEELIKVLETPDPALIATAKSVLQGAGIEHSVTNEFLQNLMVTGQGNAMEILVRREDAGAAEFILRGLTHSDSSPEQVDESSQDRPFILRFLIALGVILIPIILVVLYSLRN